MTAISQSLPADTCQGNVSIHYTGAGTCAGGSCTFPSTRMTCTYGCYQGVCSEALLLISRTSVGDPNAGQTDNLDAITAVVLGGTSLFGGRGTVIGTLIGALIVGVLRNGLVLLGVESIYQVLITGILVIAAVSIDQLARRRSS